MNSGDELQHSNGKQHGAKDQKQQRQLWSTRARPARQSLSRSRLPGSESGHSGAAASASAKAGTGSASRSLQRRQRLQDEEITSTELRVQSEQETANAPSTNKQAPSKGVARAPSVAGPVGRRRTVHETTERPHAAANYKAKKHRTMKEMKDGHSAAFLLPPSRGRGNHHTHHNRSGHGLVSGREWPGTMR